MKLRTQSVWVTVLVLLAITVIFGYAMAQNGIMFMLGPNESYRYDLPKHTLPKTAAGNYPSDAGLCIDEGFNSSIVQVDRTGTANFTCEIDHGYIPIPYDIEDWSAGTVTPLWQNASDSFTINGTGVALTNSSWKQTTESEWGQCVRLSCSSGPDLTNTIINGVFILKTNQ